MRCGIPAAIARQIWGDGRTLTRGSLVAQMGLSLAALITGTGFLYGGVKVYSSSHGDLWGGNNVVFRLHLVMKLNLINLGCNLGSSVYW